MGVLIDLTTDAAKTAIQGLIANVVHQAKLHDLTKEIFQRDEYILESYNLNKGRIQDFINQEAVSRISDLVTDKNGDKNELISSLCAKWNAKSPEEYDYVAKLVCAWISAYEEFFQNLLPPEQQYVHANLCKEIKDSEKNICNKLQDIQVGISGHFGEGAFPPPPQGGPQLVAAPTPQINIQTFTQHKIEPDCPEHLIDLSEFFDGAALREGYSWNDTVFPALKRQASILKSGQKYSAVLDASFSIAFAFGRLFPGKSRVNIDVKQSLRSGELQVWSQTDSDSGLLDMNIQSIVENENSDDIVAALSLTYDIDAAVKGYLAQNGILPHTYISCIPTNGPGFASVRNGCHADKIAEALLMEIDKVLPTNRNRKVHIFCACPNAVMFFLGRISQALGAIQIYEYDMSKREYHPTISF
ncbi:SAVED domain-containing protein [Pygmaiobacter massiliensis]|uniref:SAVED domain-containing protein n=1 Tax=Pygmaiobacter massiliensis TaxID=1917873 RepID=UPI002A8090C1|nr:SAVED domain-containing protein [Pygmaiobacter massiliensis]MDY4784378.1 SAVED domain-containing protein [Pygmaiobacter massiliensis]